MFNVKVICEGIKVEIFLKFVVFGDILILEVGDLVIVDGRILENFFFKVNESLLIGEFESVDKIFDVINKDEVVLGD